MAKEKKETVSPAQNFATGVGMQLVNGEIVNEYNRLANADHRVLLVIPTFKLDLNWRSVSWSARNRSILLAMKETQQTSFDEAEKKFLSPDGKALFNAQNGLFFSTKTRENRGYNIWFFAEQTDYAALVTKTQFDNAINALQVFLNEEKEKAQAFDYVLIPQTIGTFLRKDSSKSLIEGDIKVGLKDLKAKAPDETKFVLVSYKKEEGPIVYPDTEEQPVEEKETVTKITLKKGEKPKSRFVDYQGWSVPQSVVDWFKKPTDEQKLNIQSEINRRLGGVKPKLAQEENREKTQILRSLEEWSDLGIITGYNVGKIIENLQDEDIKKNLIDDNFIIFFKGSTLNTGKIVRFFLLLLLEDQFQDKDFQDKVIDEITDIATSAQKRVDDMAAQQKKQAAEAAKKEKLAKIIAEAQAKQSEQTQARVQRQEAAEEARSTIDYWQGSPALADGEILVYGSTNASPGQEKGFESFAKRYNVNRLYPIPIYNERGKPLTLQEIQKNVEKFLETAKKNPNTTYVIASVGCERTETGGTAPYEISQMVDLFWNVSKNIVVPFEWTTFYQSGIRPTSVSTGITPISLSPIKSQKEIEREEKRAEKTGITPRAIERTQASPQEKEAAEQEYEQKIAISEALDLQRKEEKQIQKLAKWKQDKVRKQKELLNVKVNIDIPALNDPFYRSGTSEQKTVIAFCWTIYDIIPIVSSYLKFIDNGKLKHLVYEFLNKWIKLEKYEVEYDLLKKTYPNFLTVVGFNSRISPLEDEITGNKKETVNVNGKNKTFLYHEFGSAIVINDKFCGIPGKNDGLKLIIFSLDDRSLQEVKVKKGDKEITDYDVFPNTNETFPTQQERDDHIAECTETFINTLKASMFDDKQIYVVEENLKPTKSESRDSVMGQYMMVNDNYIIETIESLNAPEQIIDIISMDALNPTRRLEGFPMIVEKKMRTLGVQDITGAGSTLYLMDDSWSVDQPQRGTGSWTDDTIDAELDGLSQALREFDAQSFFYVQIDTAVQLADSIFDDNQALGFSMYRYNSADGSFEEQPLSYFYENNLKRYYVKTQDKKTGGLKYEEKNLDDLVKQLTRAAKSDAQVVPNFEVEFPILVNKKVSRAKKGKKAKHLDRLQRIIVKKKINDLKNDVTKQESQTSYTIQSKLFKDLVRNLSLASKWQPNNPIHYQTKSAEYPTEKPVFLLQKTLDYQEPFRVKYKDSFKEQNLPIAKGAAFIYSLNVAPMVKYDSDLQFNGVPFGSQLFWQNIEVAFSELKEQMGSSSLPLVFNYKEIKPYVNLYPKFSTSDYKGSVVIKEGPECLLYLINNFFSFYRIPVIVYNLPTEVFSTNVFDRRQIEDLVVFEQKQLTDKVISFSRFNESPKEIKTILGVIGYGAEACTFVHGDFDELFVSDDENLAMLNFSTSQISERFLTTGDESINDRLNRLRCTKQIAGVADYTNLLRGKPIDGGILFYLENKILNNKEVLQNLYIGEEDGEIIPSPYKETKDVWDYYNAQIKEYEKDKNKLKEEISNIATGSTEGLKDYQAGTTFLFSGDDQDPIVQKWNNAWKELNKILEYRESTEAEKNDILEKMLLEAANEKKRQNEIFRNERKKAKTGIQFDALKDELTDMEIDNIKQQVAILTSVTESRVRNAINQIIDILRSIPNYGYLYSLLREGDLFGEELYGFLNTRIQTLNIIKDLFEKSKQTLFTKNTDEAKITRSVLDIEIDKITEEITEYKDIMKEEKRLNRSLADKQAGGLAIPMPKRPEGSEPKLYLFAIAADGKCYQIKQKKDGIKMEDIYEFYIPSDTFNPLNLIIGSIIDRVSAKTQAVELALNYYGEDSQQGQTLKQLGKKQANEMAFSLMQDALRAQPGNYVKEIASLASDNYGEKIYTAVSFFRKKFSFMDVQYLPYIKVTPSIDRYVNHLLGLMALRDQAVIRKYVIINGIEITLNADNKYKDLNTEYQQNHRVDGGPRKLPVYTERQLIIGDQLMELVPYMLQMGDRAVELHNDVLNAYLSKEKEQQTALQKCLLSPTMKQFNIIPESSPFERYEKIRAFIKKRQGIVDQELSIGTKMQLKVIEDRKASERAERRTGEFTEYQKSVYEYDKKKAQNNIQLFKDIVDHYTKITAIKPSWLTYMDLLSGITFFYSRSDKRKISFKDQFIEYSSPFFDAYRYSLLNGELIANVYPDYWFSEILDHGLIGLYPIIIGSKSFGLDSNFLKNIIRTPNFNRTNEYPFYGDDLSNKLLNEAKRFVFNNMSTTEQDTLRRDPNRLSILEQLAKEQFSTLLDKFSWAFNESSADSHYFSDKYSKLEKQGLTKSKDPIKNQQTYLIRMELFMRGNSRFDALTTPVIPINNNEVIRYANNLLSTIDDSVPNYSKFQQSLNDFAKLPADIRRAQLTESLDKIDWSTPIAMIKFALKKAKEFLDLFPAIDAIERKEDDEQAKALIAIRDSKHSPYKDLIAKTKAEIAENKKAFAYDADPLEDLVAENMRGDVVDLVSAAFRLLDKGQDFDQDDRSSLYDKIEKIKDDDTISTGEKIEDIVNLLRNVKSNRIERELIAELKMRSEFNSLYSKYIDAVNDSTLSSNSYQILDTYKLSDPRAFKNALSNAKDPSDQLSLAFLKNWYGDVEEYNQEITVGLSVLLSIYPPFFEMQNLFPEHGIKSDLLKYLLLQQSASAQKSPRPISYSEIQKKEGSYIDGAKKFVIFKEWLQTNSVFFNELRRNVNPTNLDILREIGVVLSNYDNDKYTDDSFVQKLDEIVANASSRTSNPRKKKRTSKITKATKRRR